MEKQKAGIWKPLAIILLLANFLGAAYLASKLVGPAPVLTSLSQPSSSDVLIGQITSDKEQVNQTLAAYLEDYQQDNFTYQVQIENEQLVFSGSYRVLGMAVPLYIYLTPAQLDTGAIEFSVSSIAIGSLNLPKEQILTYVANSYQLPEGVAIDAKKSHIILDLPAMTLGEDLYLTAQDLDLGQGKFLFNLYKKSS